MYYQWEKELRTMGVKGQQQFLPSLVFVMRPQGKP